MMPSDTAIGAPMMSRPTVVIIPTIDIAMSNRMYIYSADERSFSNEDLRLLSTVADQVSLAFENTKLNVAVQETQEALQTRKVVERAKSILQKQANLSEEDAYKRLQQQSMKTRRSLREIAEAVILSSEV